MPLPAQAPLWSHELARAYESGAYGQFILYGNVHDRLPVAGDLVNLSAFLEREILSNFQVVFSYDLGNGLRIVRGSEIVAAWGGSDGLRKLPREPLAAVTFVGNYVRYLGNLRSLKRSVAPREEASEPDQQMAQWTHHVACILRNVDQFLPAERSGNYEQGALASLFKDWSGEAPFVDLPFVSFLIADNLNDIHPLVAFNPRVLHVRVPLPPAPILSAALEVMSPHFGAGLAGMNLANSAQALVGVTVSALESLVKMRTYDQQPLQTQDWVKLKKQMVEVEAAGLIEFMASQRTLADYFGQEALKTWLRQDIALWQEGDTRALPMGYLLCGPVGTGKTFLVECLSGEAGVPVVKLKNFRDRWVGSSEGNLEKIFRLVRALGRCMVFIDEADQTLGKRDAGSGDSGLSGRLYSMIAQEMGDSANRGRIMWVLASSRPDLIEVDLKRPGRVDVKVPILPTTTPAESGALLRALCRRYGIDIPDPAWRELEPRMPELLTPGAAEALAVKIYRNIRTANAAPAAALQDCLAGYQPPVPPDIIEFQMRIAVREATDLQFVPPPLRFLAEGRITP